ncbi:MAG: MBL fold metallo-hydrolase, partial [Candidatus Berkelbacteria bacterium]|nr:MBL fold metallo-hydrolase [Candidatus Berkelbacteria bacterium]
MKITCLVDNLGSNNKRLKPENGLSYFIEKGDHKILFDTGSNDALVKNAKTLGIDLALVESVIISHGHYDHGGGLPAFFRVNKSAKVYIKESAFGPFFHDHQLFSRYIGLPTKKLNQFR